MTEISEHQDIMDKCAEVRRALREMAAMPGMNAMDVTLTRVMERHLNSIQKHHGVAMHSAPVIESGGTFGPVVHCGDPAVTAPPDFMPNMHLRPFSARFVDPDRKEEDDAA